MRRLRAVGARIASAAAARFTLSDPATERIPTAIIAINLINCQDRPTTRKITNNARLEAVIALVPSLAD